MADPARQLREGVTYRVRDSLVDLPGAEDDANGDKPHADAVVVAGHSGPTSREAEFDGCSFDAAASALVCKRMAVQLKDQAAHDGFRGRRGAGRARLQPLRAPAGRQRQVHRLHPDVRGPL